eukprot:scaffold3765_cov122-Isochrysis_galbana.AAC.11
MLGLCACGGVLQLDQVLWQHQRWLENVPFPLLALRLHRAVHGREAVIVFLANGLVGRALGLGAA